MSLALWRVSRWRRQRWTAICCLLSVLSLTACAERAPHAAQTPRGPAPPRTQFPLPPADGAGHSFTLLDNRRMRLADYAGHVVVFDFYATWCAPCRTATPHLVEMHKRYHERGLRIIGLNVGGAKDRALVADFKSEFGIPYLLGFPEPEMANLYLSDDDRIPQAFVFDRQGQLVRRFISYDSTLPAELERVVKEMLGEK